MSWTFVRGQGNDTNHDDTGRSDITGAKVSRNTERGG
jgi:hypothetical protein